MRFCKYFPIEFYTFNLHVFRLSNLEVIDVLSFYGLTKFCPKLHVFMAVGSINETN
jgi:hypothetical protein